MKFAKCLWGAMLLPVILISPILGQKQYALGDQLVRGNRLFSVKSKAGAQLYRHERSPKPLALKIDALMAETAWNSAAVIKPFVDEKERADQTTLRLMFDQDSIYLYWRIPETRGITAKVNKPDVDMTGDDYTQVNLTPWLPDSIKFARDYYYSIVVNPNGAVWDAYFDPYLDGYFFTSWDSQVKAATTRRGEIWTVEMAIPFSWLDNYSDPGWKWNLEFVHASRLSAEQVRLYMPDHGVTVTQANRVRRPGLVAYYWPRPEFMQEVKPDMSLQSAEPVAAIQLTGAPVVNGGADTLLWAGSGGIQIVHSDKLGELLPANAARAAVGVTSQQLCFSLEAEGARIDSIPVAAGELGSGMAAQMAGVNGVFVDRTLFAQECFWLLIQPREKGADHIHQDYYLVMVDNRGQVRGTHYDPYGAPFRDWRPEAQVDIYNTPDGWGAEVSLDLTSFDLPAANDPVWGLNIFRNRLLPDSFGDGSQLQAWRYTANHFLDPATFGDLTGVELKDAKVVQAGLARKKQVMRDQLEAYGDAYEDLTQPLKNALNQLNVQTATDLAAAEMALEQVDHQLGIIDAAQYYRSVPHPQQGGYPLMDVQFIGKRGWAVGAMGTVLMTTNDGKSWQQIEIGSDADFYRVDFVNAKEGWIAGGRLRIADTNESMRHDKRGGYGYIYHTRDGGKTWQCQYAEQGRHLFGLDFVTSSVGYASGERGFLLKTVDGGAHWQVMHTTSTISWLYGLAFTDERNGFAVGQLETVIRTTDGGRSWKPVHAPADRKFYGFRPFYRDVAFNGPTGCIVGQNGSVLISHDGGDSWQPTATHYDTHVRELLDLRSVQFVTPKLGYAVGELGSKIMMTDDGGRSWVYRPLPNTDWLRAVWADAKGRLVVAGEREKILLSKDRGHTWEVLRGDAPKTDVLVLMAHGDDAAINLGAFHAHYALNEGRQIVDVGVMSDVHSSEYEETYNLEHDRDMWLSGVRTSSNFNEFETGNNGADYYHFTEREWEGEENVVRHMVAAIRAYRPAVVITHGGVYGDYDGRATRYQAAPDSRLLRLPAARRTTGRSSPAWDLSPGRPRSFTAWPANPILRPWI